MLGAAVFILDIMGASAIICSHLSIRASMKVV